MVPVSVRADEQRQDLGNRISFAFIELPVEIASRSGRLARVHEATAAFKTSGRPAGTGAVLGALGLLPGPPQEPGRAHRVEPARLQPHRLEHPRARGSRLHARRRASEAYPVVPLAEQHALVDRDVQLPRPLFFGMYADPGGAAEVDQLPAFLDAEVLALAGPRKRRSREAHRRGASPVPANCGPARAPRQRLRAVLRGTARRGPGSTTCASRASMRPSDSSACALTR